MCYNFQTSEESEHSFTVMKSSPGKSEFFKSDDVNVGSDQGASKVVISFGETDQSTSS